MFSGKSQRSHFTRATTCTKILCYLFHGKPRRHDVRRILLVVQNHGVGPDVLEQQRLDEVHAKSISARQAMRRDILRDVRVPAARRRLANLQEA